MNTPALEKINKESDHNLMEFSTLLKTRKSTRSYKPAQIKKEELEKVLLAGYAAPVGSGKYDTLHFTVIQNAGLLAQIAEAHAKAANQPGSSPFYGAPTVVLLSTSRKDSSVAYANAGCIIENMALAATELGLGSVYLFGFLNALNSQPELLKKLNLPQDFLPISGIALGYPTEPLTARELSKTISTDIIQ